MCSVIAAVVAWSSFWIWIAWLARGSGRLDQAAFTTAATQRAIDGGARTAAEIAYAIQDQTYNGVYLEYVVERDRSDASVHEARRSWASLSLSAPPCC